jgi:hydrogenase maturation protease
MDGATATRLDEPRQYAPLQNKTVLLLGLGNTLLADDGVGIHIVRRLARDPMTPACLRPVDGGTLGFRLLEQLSQADAVLIIDAAQFGAAAGTVRLLDRHELARHVGRTGRTSAHEAGLADLLTLARLEGFAPRHLALLGIQPRTIDWGDSLSPPVERAAAMACECAVQTALGWVTAP